MKLEETLRQISLKLTQEKTQYPQINSAQFRIYQNHHTIEISQMIQISLIAIQKKSLQGKSAVRFLIIISIPTQLTLMIVLKIINFTRKKTEKII